MSGWQSNPVDYPAHYAGDGTIECRDALRSMMTDVELPPPVAYWWGCAFKYLWRWPRKGGRQDVEKARRCLEELLGAMADAKDDEAAGDDEGIDESEQDEPGTIVFKLKNWNPDVIRKWYS